MRRISSKWIGFSCIAMVVLGVGAMFFAGCASNKSKAEFAPLPTPGKNATRLTAITLTNQLAPELAQPGNASFTLGPGDTLDIEIVGSPTSRAVTKVGPDGKIYYNLLPGLDVWGLTLSQAREQLEKELGKYLNQPRVSANLRTVGSKFVWLLGRVNRPGLYPTAGGMTLLEALALAGGPAHSLSQNTSVELADLKHSFVVRNGQFLPVDFYRLLREGDMSQNIYLQPDDFVFVRSAAEQEVYVLGSVKVPRAIQYTENMSLVSAMAGGAGPEKYNWLANYDNGIATKDAYLSHIAIVRGSLATPQIGIYDYGAIVKGRAADVLLEPGDIIYVPNSPLTTVKRYFNMIANTFVTTVAANEGIRAGGGKVGVGVSVPVGGTSSSP